MKKSGYGKKVGAKNGHALYLNVENNSKSSIIRRWIADWRLYLV